MNHGITKVMLNQKLELSSLEGKFQITTAPLIHVSKVMLAGVIIMTSIRAHQRQEPEFNQRQQLLSIMGPSLPPSPILITGQLQQTQPPSLPCSGLRSHPRKTSVLGQLTPTRGSNALVIHPLLLDGLCLVQPGRIHWRCGRS